MQLKQKNSAGVSKPPVWKWRTQDGRHFRVKEMATAHLFNTILMIWNHTMPESAKFRPYREYEFGDFYTKKYLVSAVQHMATELVARKDVTAVQKAILEQMMLWLERNQVEMEAVMQISKV